MLEDYEECKVAKFQMEIQNSSISPVSNTPSKIIARDEESVAGRVCNLIPLRDGEKNCRFARQYSPENNFLRTAICANYALALTATSCINRNRTGAFFGESVPLSNADLGGVNHSFHVSPWLALANSRASSRSSNPELTFT